jgi:hypothetical protein
MTPSQLLGSSPVFSGLWTSIKDVWGAVWWFALPLLTFFIFWDCWFLYLHFRFVTSIKWKLLEIKVPKNIMKTPKAMEQVFAAAHTPYSYGLRFAEKYWEGKEEYWMSFEMVCSAGESHFYLRVPEQYRHLMESAVYSQYPDAEITEVEDYVSQMPYVLPNKTYDVYGDEQILREPNCYPIRTYPMFEEMVEERRVDPVAMLIEAMSRLKDDEKIWIQIMARPTGDDWKEAGRKIVNKIAGKEEKKSSASPVLGVTLGEALRAPFEHPSMEVQKKKEAGQNFRILMLTPGEREIMEGIERKMGKLGFETTIRFVYIDRRDSFSRDHVASVMGFFRQFNTQNLNLLKPDKKTMARGVHYWFVNLRLKWRKRLVFEHYRDMVFNHHKSILNIEELATIYHFPIMGVGAAFLEKIESRKGGPPGPLPIIEE